MKTIVEAAMIFDDVQFGIAVKDARLALGITQRELAHRIGYKDGQSICSVEVARASESMTLRRYADLCAELDLNPTYFWDFA